MAKKKGDITALYERLSRDDEKYGDSISIVNQKKMLESFAKENGFALQLILETHSDTIVNYFGRAISEGSIPSDAIAIYIFDKEDCESRD